MRDGLQISLCNEALSVFETVTVVFDVPPAILEGLSAGSLERVGGVIRDSITKEVVMWLKEGAPVAAAASGVTLPVVLPVLAVVAVGAVTIGVMHHKFQAVERQLGSIDSKIDAQNSAKLRTGFKLAADTERMASREEARRQLGQARALLDEGSRVYWELFEGAKHQDAEKFPSLPPLLMFISGQVAVIKSYLACDERTAAFARAVELRRSTLEAIHHYLECSLNAQTKAQNGLYEYIAPLVDAVESSIKRAYSYCFGGDQDITLQLAASNDLETQIQNILGAFAVKSLQPPAEAVHLQSLEDFLHGYCLECEAIPVHA